MGRVPSQAHRLLLKDVMVNNTTPYQGAGSADQPDRVRQEMAPDTTRDDTSLPQQLGTLPFWRDVLLILTLSVAGLVYGAAYLIPLTFAVLLFVLLIAVIDHVARWRVFGVGVPHWAANLIGIAMVVAGLAVVFLILVNQTNEVAAALPTYRDRVEDLAAGVAATLGDRNAAAVREAVENANMPQLAVRALGPAGSVLTFFFLVGLYVPFMLVERGPMSRKITIAAHDERRGRRLRRLLHSISEGLQTYVKVKTFASLLTGLFSYAVMKPMGLQFAETWALLAFALNYIPSVGSILGVVFPALVSLVQFDTLAPFLIIVFGCGAVQFFIGNVLEPAIAGRSLNISPLVIILGLTFWGSVWGVIGALLSVPITTCMIVVLANIPETRWLAMLMSGDGHLITPDEGGDGGWPSAERSAEVTASKDG
ncbi:AI-2E family transporter [Tropicimonas marinistellae]|uniref:AI-2E family transporter n=1 Tax=Tropicimonas marinistellae TaxID=1739787 RepID=UPI00082FC511|nr:AI-2E family transporter [Tropicimonas marinistellae]